MRASSSSAPLRAKASSSVRGRLSSSRALTVVPRAAGGADERQPWDFGRFARTVVFFNDPARAVQGFFQRMFGGGGVQAAAAAAAAAAAPASAGAPAPIVTLIDRTAERPASSAAAPNSNNCPLPGVTLVTGATGGVGRRVVSLLLARGAHVRALVRDVPKARAMLGALPAAPGAALELLPGDLTQPATLPPSGFAGVRRVVSCAATVVQPKEGDDERRSKYSQGIKFYDPEIASDAPIDVELKGMEALLERVGPSVGSAKGLALLDASAPDAAAALRERWGALDDCVMGGVSESSMVFSPAVRGAAGGDQQAAAAVRPAAVFRGVVSTANRGGFASVRSRNFEPPVDVSAYDGIELLVRGDGQRYKAILRPEAGWDGVGYCCSFVAAEAPASGEGGDGWTAVRLPFSSFFPVFRARRLAGQPPFDPAAQSISSLQIMLSKFEYDGELNPEFAPGAFELPIASIRAYVAPERAAPARLVHVSSAGVTRPMRPGIDVEQEPPAVKLNDALGGLLTYKLAGEQAIRESGVPYAVIRPTALTEEPRGMPVQPGQGDVLKGKIGRDDVAELCVELLTAPASADLRDLTFELKSTVPFSQPWTQEASAAALEAEGVSGDSARDWAALLKGEDGAGLRRGVTGRTVDGVYTGDGVEPGYVDPFDAAAAAAEQRVVVGPAPPARQAVGASA